MTLICAKFDADLINISKVTSRKTKWPLFFGLPGTSVVTRHSFWRFPDWKFFFSRVYLIDKLHPLFRSSESGKNCAACSQDFMVLNCNDPTVAFRVRSLYLLSNIRHFSRWSCIFHSWHFIPQFWDLHFQHPHGHIPHCFNKNSVNGWNIQIFLTHGYLVFTARYLACYSLICIHTNSSDRVILTFCITLDGLKKLEWWAYHQTTETYDES